MRTKKEIRARIKIIRTTRNEVKQIKNAEGYILLSNVTVRALKWVLGYKRKPQYWCTSCSLFHYNLKCPHCGDETKYVFKETGDNGS